MTFTSSKKIGQILRCQSQHVTEYSTKLGKEATYMQSITIINK